MSKQKELLQLTEEIGKGIEERLKLSPLASRIYALLILSPNEGLNFEAIREAIQASKSSISVNINLLKQLGYITTKTKSGDRKRYFQIAKYSSLLTLELYLKDIDKENEMLQSINSFNKKYYPEKFIEEKSLGEIYQDYLIKKQKLVEDTIQVMSSFKNTEKTS